MVRAFALNLAAFDGFNLLARAWLSVELRPSGGG
jgi:hypothetical protein